MKSLNELLPQVPKGECPESGVDCAAIIQMYLEALTRDAIRTAPDGPFFITGCERTSKFMNSPMGINKLRGIPKEIATFLNLPEAKKFTGHCFRR